ncbi:potassium-transporting ATPase subunit KdpC [Erythrobacter sp. BLCC-B19]|uniref:potassium-transporting ATPase subunit KdpC n=1 Tax=Erythrobacter sp. BLCC-B19 TaxID=3025315 RepID=UPI00235E1066|nr:potassium-transporting ATPase subunit KdpC [Erythrobacter sp. BLCC-B19]WDA40975.1 potassium-transporting ATPase subunit KdpC [Erythrobacter sp. BLCC-B19]
MQYILPAIRLWLVTVLVCVVLYTGLILGFAQVAAPFSANGSIIEAGGRPVGSALVAQKFTSPRYFWPRPSAPDYNAMAAAGSNKSPTSPDLTARAQETLAAYGATAANPVPADLVAASGGGLDPHISLAGALYQVDRVAAARGLAPAAVRQLVEDQATSVGGALAPERIVNVLTLNLALDRLGR